MWPPLLGKGGMGGAAGGGRPGGGGGGMLRTVRRQVRGSVKDPFSHSSSPTASSTSSTRHTNKRGKNPSDILSLSSSICSSPFGHPVASSDGEGFEWECVDGSEYERGFDWSGPSRDEAQFAVSSLLQALTPASSSKSIEDRLAYDWDMDVPDEATSPTVMGKRVSSVGSLGTQRDWVERSVQLCNPRMLQPYGSNRVYDAFHLLQTVPCVQRMVVSLSSDKAVWGAVMNNEVVQELRKSLGQAENSGSENPDNGSDGPDAAAYILSWIFNNTKTKVMELIEKITNLVNVLFQSPEPEVEQSTKDTNAFNRIVRASIFLSIVVMFIVVSERSRK